MKKHQAGASLFIVLVLLAVMAVAALSLSRATMTSTTVAGNMSFKAAAMQASEAGLSEAFAQLQALAATDVDATKGTWYYPSPQATDAAGLPSGVTWSSVPSVTVPGGYTASYVVERLCTGTFPVADITTQCVVKRVAASGSAKAGTEQMDSPAAVQYRTTVYVQGPKGTNTFVQSMATKAS
jgi:type IV pilus assembly protein PilX